MSEREEMPFLHESRFIKVIDIDEKIAFIETYNVTSGFVRMHVARGDPTDGLSQ